MRGSAFKEKGNGGGGRRGAPSWGKAGTRTGKVASVSEAET